MSSDQLQQLRLGERGAAASEAADRPAPVGLSTCNISPQIHLRESRITIAIGGNYIKLRGPELSGDLLRAKTNRNHTPRGTVKANFSPRSRHNLLEKLATIDQRRMAYRSLMVTLTYPENWPASPEQWKRDLQNFLKRLLRRYPGAGIIWRMEPQKRGAPHFHLLIFNVRYLPYKRVAEDWAAITNGNQDSCSRVERVRSWRGVMSYASKYLAKLDGNDRQFLSGAGGQALDEVGRLWGVVNASALPKEVLTVALTIEQFYRYRRNLDRHKGSILRRVGKSHTRIRDATRGVSAFLPWDVSVQLLNLETGSHPVEPLIRQSLRIQEQVRWEREALADYRASQPQRAKRGLTAEKH